MHPIAMAVMAAKNTAPAAMSLIKPMRSWYSGWMKSDTFSTAVFRPSIPRTKPMAKI